MTSLSPFSPGRSLARWSAPLALCALLAALVTSTLTGCASTSTPQTVFDLGALGAPTGATSAVRPAPKSALAAVSVAELSVPAWLDSTDMLYRLNYSDPQQVRPYANSRWSMPPSALLGQRLKWRIVQAGGAVMSAADNRQNVLRIEVDDFSQSFDSATTSRVQVSLRATLVSNRTLIAQKTFVYNAPSDPHAAGSARALTRASDEAIDAIIAWLGTTPVNR